MAEKRERFEVIKDILLVVQKHQKIGPTRLIQLSNLSPVMFKEYIKELTKNNLINEEVQKNKKTYELTDKGYNYLEKYKMFKNFVEELGL